MTAKLIKLENGIFHLWLNVGTKDADHIASNKPLIGEWGRDLLKYKLSLKNCQAIERGYDLDELAEKECNDPNLSWENDYAKEKYKEGFQKALELLGDKKFSGEDMEKAYSLGWGNSYKFSEGQPITDLHEFIQSLQQTEWDVEVETIEYGIGNDKDGRPVIENKFLLDAEGCLILKLKSE